MLALRSLNNATKSICKASSELQLPSNTCILHTHTPNTPHPTSCAASITLRCHCHPINNCWQIICHLAALDFGIFPLRLPLACAKNFERNVSASLSISLTFCLAVSLSGCLAVYWLYGLCRFRNRNKEFTCHNVYRGICHFARIAAAAAVAANANAIAHFSHHISSSSSLGRHLITLPTGHMCACVCVYGCCCRRVAQIAGRVRCKK